MRRISLLFIMAFLTACPVYCTAETFDSFINDATDGNSFQQSILLKNICDYSACDTEKSAQDIFSRTVFKQECDYISNKYGNQGAAWEIIDNEPVEAELYGEDNYYDQLTVKVYILDEQKDIYFDITDSVKELNKWLRRNIKGYYQ